MYQVLHSYGIVPKVSVRKTSSTLRITACEAARANSARVWWIDQTVDSDCLGGGTAIV